MRKPVMSDELLRRYRVDAEAAGRSSAGRAWFGQVSTTAR